MRKLGGIDLPTIQKFINLWFSLSLDLHGNEISTNAASYFANGLKGRAQEEKWDDHLVDRGVLRARRRRPTAGLERKAIPMRTAMNEVLRDWYVGDCEAGVQRWNRILERHGMSDRLRLPDRKFNRGIGMFSSLHFDPTGAPLSDERVGAPQARVAAVAVAIASTCSASWPSRSTSRASSPTTSRRRSAASTGSRSISSTCGPRRDHESTTLTALS